MIRLSPCFLLFFIAGTPYDVDRAVFRFQIRLGQVFSHNSHTEKLDATHKQDHTDHRRPSCHRISPDQCPYYQNQNHKKRNSAEYHAEHCCHRQRSHRKPGNSLQRIFKSWRRDHLVSPADRSTFSYSSHSVLNPTQLKIPLEKRLYSLICNTASTIFRHMIR